MTLFCKDCHGVGVGDGDGDGGSDGDKMIAMILAPSIVTSIQVRFGPIHLGVTASLGTPTIPSANVGQSNIES